MPIELAPLLSNVRAQQVDGVDVFELAGATVAIGGIGEKFARRAAEALIERLHPERLVSAGMVGAVSPT
jgi:nucleoside phosphorylase